MILREVNEIVEETALIVAMVFGPTRSGRVNFGSQPYGGVTSVLDSDTQAALDIRAFELALLQAYQSGWLSGTVHTCIGQENCAVALQGVFDHTCDTFLGTHRAHGHFLAQGGSAEGLMAELMGRDGALCEGRGGTQHIQSEHFLSNGIQGAMTPIAVGMAFATKYQGEPGVTVVQMGDGTLGQGVLYESLGFAALTGAPVLFLLEDNGIAQSTPTDQTLTGSMESRFSAFGIPCTTATDDNVIVLRETLRRVLKKVREGEPQALITKTRRLMAHSKGDDTRPKLVLENLTRADPLSQVIQQSESAADYLESRLEFYRAMAADLNSRPPLSSPLSLRDAYPDSLSSWAPEGFEHGLASDQTVAQALNEGLMELLSDRRCFLLGEDLTDPYGGAFKITKGLSTAYPDQVFSTPISEAAIAGFAIGLSLKGLRPIAEIMFGDFITLAVDQLVNSAAKFHFMFGGSRSLPLVVRVVSGGGRGYGPTHSQNLETLLCGTPGLRVIAPSHRHDVKKLLKHVVLQVESPVVWVEAKTMYSRRIDSESIPGTRRVLRKLPNTRGFGVANLVFVPDAESGERADATIVTYGEGLPLVEDASLRLLIEHEVNLEIVVITQLWPLDASDIVDSVKRTGNVVVVEPGVSDYGFGAAVLSALSQRVERPFQCSTIGSVPVPIAAAPVLESQILPSVDIVVAQVLEML